MIVGATSDSATIRSRALAAHAGRSQIGRVPITYDIDREARLVRATVKGDFTVDDMVACVSGAAAEAGEHGFNIIADHREVGEPATRVQLEQLVGHLTTLRRYFAGARWAVTVASPASFGMMRMLGVLAERVPIEVRVFTDADTAERWARGDTRAGDAAGFAPPAAGA